MKIGGLGLELELLQEDNRRLRAALRSAPCESCREKDAQIQALMEEIEQWQSASGLESGGDPSGVTPDAMSRYWEGVEAENERLRQIVAECEARIAEPRRFGDVRVELERLEAENERLRAEVERLRETMRQSLQVSCSAECMAAAREGR